MPPSPSRSPSRTRPHVSIEIKSNLSAKNHFSHPMVNGDATDVAVCQSVNVADDLGKQKVDAALLDEMGDVEENGFSLQRFPRSQH